MFSGSITVALVFIATEQREISNREKHSIINFNNHKIYY